MKRWNWLLVVPTVAPLLTPLYNRVDPVLWGVPFFYWYQLACAVLTTVVITTVYLATRPRPPALRLDPPPVPRFAAPPMRGTARVGRAAVRR